MDMAMFAVLEQGRRFNWLIVGACLLGVLALLYLFFLDPYLHRSTRMVNLCHDIEWGGGEKRRNAATRLLRNLPPEVGSFRLPDADGTILDRYTVQRGDFGDEIWDVAKARAYISDDVVRG